jgi:arabinose-5-phosphate isomerase
VMTANPVTIAPKTLASEALSIMNEKQITCLFALNDAGAPQGIVHIHDLLRAGVQ